MDNLELLNKLKELGVTFILPIPNQWGHESYMAEPEELLNLVNDPAALYAKHFDVTKDQYIAWLNNRYSVTCAGKTSKGKPCKKIIKGGSNINPKKWVEMQGEYCEIHGDGNGL